VSIALELGVPFATVAQALEGFSGVHRRFEVKGTFAGITVVDDYGHHPAEIQATLAAAADWLAQNPTGNGGSDPAGSGNGKRGRPYSGRIVAIFQPHRYTRTRELREEFMRAFFGADLLVLTEIYAAGEEPIAGISGQNLFEAIAAERQRRELPTRFVARREEIAGRIVPELKPGDLVLTLGAGNIWEAGEELITRLREKES
jgi:UDP-N-acetylmuramate--alanine ligase